MKLTHLNLTNFRNFSNYELYPTEKINLILGDNGVGKTSILEAIYFLGMNRSFRNRSYQAVLKYGTNFCQIVGKFNDDFIVGIEKHQNPNKSQLKISGEQHSTADLAQLIPIQLINHETFHLLDGSPQHRRTFVDWGVFYAEPQYYRCWQRFQHALKQRNALLKNMDLTQIAFWEQELAQQTVHLEHYRRSYLNILLPLLKDVLQLVALPLNLSLDYYPGWDNDRDYLTLLQQYRQRDALLGSTQLGPHRADIRIKINHYDADDILSRGQQKMFAFAMRIAQAQLLYQFNQKNCLVLVDDLAAELDSQHLAIACQMLFSLPNQIFITALEKSLFTSLLESFEMNVFHVER